MEKTEEIKEIVIVGGGICGLATALALHRKGINSVVLERYNTLQTAGAAIIIHPNGWRALDQLHVASLLRQTAIPIQSGQSITVDDGKREEIPLGNGEVRCLKRADLIKILADNLPCNTIHFGCKVQSVKLDPITSYPILQLHDGSVLKAKVVIGCDGLNSCVANILGINSVKLFSTCAIRGFTYYEDSHYFGNEFLVMTKHQVQLGRMPVTHKLVYWFLTRKWTSQDLMVSKDQELIKQSTLESMKGFPVDVVEMIEKSDLDSLHLTDLRYRAPWNLLCRSLRRGTVTVAGDAMHAMGPFLAQGGSASLEDAIVLARCLAQKYWCNGKIEEALDQYVKERRMRIVELSVRTFLIGKRLDTSALLVRFLIIVLTTIFFSDPVGHIHHYCGQL